MSNLKEKKALLIPEHLLSVWSFITPSTAVFAAPDCKNLHKNQDMEALQ